jgi:hypothetical protein
MLVRLVAMGNKKITNRFTKNIHTKYCIGQLDRVILIMSGWGEVVAVFATNSR